MNRRRLAYESPGCWSDPGLAIAVLMLIAAPTAFAQPCQWEALEGGGFVGNTVAIRAMTTLDDGRGSALYVGGIFTESLGNPGQNIARWDGKTWSRLDTGTGFIETLIVFDDGAGPAIVAGGSFNRAGSIPGNGIAKWDGHAWSALGAGMFSLGHFGPDHVVRALAVFDDGTGPALYAGGHFDTAGGVPAKSIAKWDGHAWSAVGAGLFSGSGDAGDVRALAVYDDGTGPALYAAGVTVLPGETYNAVVRWDGKRWQTVGGYVASLPDALGVARTGAGPNLFVGGQLYYAGGLGLSGVAGWNNQSWYALGEGTAPSVGALMEFDEGSGPALYVGGGFSYAGGVLVRGIARWDGTTWEALGKGVRRSPVGPIVHHLAVFDDGDGPALYVGGDFDEAGGVPGTKGIARWKCARCSADCDTSTGVGVLDIFDFLCFQNRFAGGDPYACDCDGSTGPAVCDIFDFLCFQNRFAAGCP